MNITWMIGNGFDIRAGLKTSYSDFYHSDYVQKSRDNCIYASINEDTKSWADFERGLGEYSKSINEESMEGFLESVAACNEDFTKYLSEEEKYYPSPDDNQIKQFNKTLTHFQNSLLPDDANDYMAILEVYRRNRVNLMMRNSFIVFNYTNICARYWDKIISGATKIGALDAVVGKSELCNIHGTLEKGIMLGCDNSAQYNATLLNEKKHYIDKPAMNSLSRSGNTAMAERIIASTNIFCIYGMSVGDTDLRWWNIVAKRTLENTYHRIVIFCYKPDFDKTNIPRAIDRIETAKDHFISKTRGLNSEQKNTLRKRILVTYDIDDIFCIAHNPDIYTPLSSV